MLALPHYRVRIVWLGAALFVILGILPLSGILDAEDFNVILMLAGIMGIVSMFVDSGMPALLADMILERTPTVRWAVVFLSLFAGLISVFVDNVATVLMIAPVAMAAAKKLDINPVPMLIAISVSSNVQGAATLVGDTTSIMLGGYAGMDFLDFFVFMGRPSMFWVTELGALMSCVVIWWLFRHDNEPVNVTEEERPAVTDYMPSVLLIAAVVLLIAASFIPGRPATTNGLICSGLMLSGVIIDIIRTRDVHRAARVIESLNYNTLALLLGLFVVIGGIEEAGVIDSIASVLSRLVGSNVFLAYTIIVWVSVLCSAFIDNIPYVAAMLPVVQGMAAMMGIEPYVLYFGLLAGATLGGNLTPMGASANVAAIGILTREGLEVKNRDFLRIGVPVTLTAITAGYIFVWLVWGV